MKVSVAVASKHGSTQEIGEAIAAELKAQGHEPRLHDMATASILDLDDSEAIVLGSAVYFGKWMMAASVFAQDISARIEGRPVWLFSTGPVGNPLKPADAQTEIDVDEQIKMTGASEHKVFAGRVDKSHLRLGERSVVLALRVQDGDYRDWDEVRDWARSIAGALTAREQSQPVS